MNTATKPKDHPIGLSTFLRGKKKCDLANDQDTTGGLNETPLNKTFLDLITPWKYKKNLYIRLHCEIQLPSALFYDTVNCKLMESLASLKSKCYPNTPQLYLSAIVSH